MNTRELIDLCRANLNERPFETDTNQEALFWTDADLLVYINNAQIHYNAFVNDLDESYNIDELKVYSDTIVNNQIIFPAELQKIKLVELYFNPSDETGVEVIPIDIVERIRYRAPYRYYFQGDRLRFTPELSGYSFVKILFLRRATALANDVDVPPLPLEIHENIALRATVNALLRDKQATLAGYWQKILAEKDQFAANMLKPRQNQAPATVRAREDWEYGQSGFLRYY